MKAVDCFMPTPPPFKKNPKQTNEHKDTHFNPYADKSKNNSATHYYLGYLMHNFLKYETLAYRFWQYFFSDAIQFTF